MKVECLKHNEIIVEHGNLRIKLEGYRFVSGTVIHLYLNPNTELQDGEPIEGNHFVLKEKKGVE